MDSIEHERSAASQATSKFTKRICFDGKANSLAKCGPRINANCAAWMMRGEQASGAVGQERLAHTAPTAKGRQGESGIGRAKLA
jgi:hypothetical protein